MELMDEIITILCLMSLLILYIVIQNLVSYRSIRNRLIDIDTNLQELKYFAEFARRDNGKLLWHFDLAKAIQSRFLESPIFVTYEGYSFCLVAYFNNERPNRGYVSIYLRCVRGDNDGYLKWPIDKVVNISLFSKSSGGFLETRFRTLDIQSGFYPSKFGHEPCLSAHKVIFGNKLCFVNQSTGFGVPRFVLINALKQNSNFLTNGRLSLFVQVS